VSVRSFVRPSVRPLPILWTWYLSENEWSDFATNWHKWSIGTRRWSGQHWRSKFKVTRRRSI